MIVIHPPGLFIVMASHDAVIVTGANPCFADSCMEFWAMVPRKDAHISEKSFNATSKSPFHNIAFGHHMVFYWVSKQRTVNL